MEKENYYLRNEILSYTDLETNARLHVSIDSSVEANGKWTNLNPSILCFSIFDGRIGTNSSVSVFLNHDNAVKLVNNVTKLFENNPQVVFTNGSNIHVAQYTKKRKRELIFSFAYNNKPVIQLALFDSLSQPGKAAMTMEMHTFRSIGKILKEFVDNPISTNIGMKQLVSNDILIKNIKLMCNETKKEILDVLKRQPKIMTNDIDINEYDESPSQESEVQKQFKEAYDKSSGFSHVDLGLEKSFIGEDKKLTKIKQPFISTFLDYDINRLSSWMTSIICTTEKSTSELFAPFDFILNLIDITDEDRDELKNEFGYNLMQYSTIYLLKKNVKDTLKTGNYTKNIPALKFNKKFVRGTKLHRLSEEIITIFIIYLIFIKFLSDLGQSDIDIYKRTFFSMKLLFSPFIFSIEVDDELVDDLCTEFNKVGNCGLIEQLKVIYTGISCGGNLEIHSGIFEKCCRSFVKTIKTEQTMQFFTEEETKKIINEYNIYVPTKPLNNGEDIKRAIFEIPSIEKESESVVEEKTLEPNMEMEEEDKRLDLFLESAVGIVDDETVNNIKSCCKKYSDLPNFFRQNDVPHEVFKIKRVLDIDNTLTARSQVLKKAKILKEESQVTETSVMQEETTQEFQKDFDVQSLLSTEGIF